MLQLGGLVWPARVGPAAWAVFFAVPAAPDVFDPAKAAGAETTSSSRRRLISKRVHPDWPTITAMLTDSYQALAEALRARRPRRPAE